MAENQGSWFQGAAHTARDDRYVIECMADGLGAKYSTDCVASFLTGMKSQVAPGHLMLLHISPLSGVYHGYNDAAVELTHEAADGTDREDLIVAEVIDAQYDGGVLNEWHFRIVKGSTGAYPNPPALPNNCIPIASVRIPGSAVALSSGYYTDRRWFYASHGAAIPCTSATRPGVTAWNPYIAPYAGMRIYETDTRKTMIYQDNGVTAGWYPEWAVPWGEIGYTQTTGSPGTGTSIADLTGLSVTVTVPAGRKLLVTGHCPIRIDGLSDRVAMWIREGSTKLGAAGDFRGAVAQQTFMFHGSARINSPSSGSHTYKLSAERVGGSADIWNANSAVAAGEPAYIMVEDLGPA